MCAHLLRTLEVRGGRVAPPRLVARAEVSFVLLPAAFAAAVLGSRRR